MSQAVNGLNLGIAQTWQDFSGSRALDTNYTNTTGRTIQVSVGVTNTVGGEWRVIVGGVIIGAQSSGVAVTGNASFLVPPGVTYQIQNFGGASGIVRWAELR